MVDFRKARIFESAETIHLTLQCRQFHPQSSAPSRTSSSIAPEKPPFTTDSGPSLPSSPSKMMMQSRSYRKVPSIFFTAPHQSVITLLSTAFDDPSALLKHELAYCLGQMKRTSALPVLESVLRKEDEDPMVRHEVCHPATYLFIEVLSYNRTGQAAEAMGAISSTASVPILREYLSDPNRSVRETCEIALAKIDWDNSEEGRKHLAAKDSPDSMPYVCPFPFLACSSDYVMIVHIPRSIPLPRLPTSCRGNQNLTM